MRHNVPNSEVFAAKTDREMALVAVKHGIELPKHLSHLPTLPAPKSASEKQLIAAEMQSAEAALEGETAIKERPPRKARLGLLDVTESSFGKAVAGIASAVPSRGMAALKPSNPTGAPPTPSSSSTPMDDGYLAEKTAVKEKAPSTRKAKKDKKKASKAEKAALAAQMDDGYLAEKTAVKEKAPSSRKKAS